MLFTGNIYTIAVVATSVVFIAVAFLHMQNTAVKTTRYTYSSPDMPRRFRGFRIAHISDYHNTKQLEHKILSRTAAEKPDIIAVTGDLFDCRRTDVQAGISLAEKLVKIAPVYMVCGNHEAKIENIRQVKEELSTAGVDIVENRTVFLHRNGEHISLCGLADPQSLAAEKGGKEAGKKSYRSYVLEFMKETEGFCVVLAHRPEFIHTYRDSGINLALTGHAHGGQFGIPFTDIGVLVPNQGFFPPYAAGCKKLDGTTVIISRGIGNSVFPFRLFNYPGVVTVEFE